MEMRQNRAIKKTYGTAFIYSANQNRQDFHLSWHRPQIEKNCKVGTGNASLNKIGILTQRSII